MVKELALNVPGANGSSVSLEPIAGMPDAGFPTLQKIIQLGIIYAFTTAILLALFMIIFAGLQWITSGGDAKAIDGARKRITYAVIGLIVTFMSFFIINIVSGFIGINLLSITNTSSNKSNSGSGTQGGGAATPSNCTRHTPILAINPNNVHLAAGGTARYHIEITNKDNAKCTNRTFNVIVSVPSGFTTYLDKSSLNTKPGTKYSDLLLVNSPKSIDSKTYTGSVKISPSNQSATFKYIIN